MRFHIFTALISLIQVKFYVHDVEKRRRKSLESDFPVCYSPADSNQRRSAVKRVMEVG